MSQLQSLYDVYHLAQVKQNFATLPFDPLRLVAVDHIEPTPKLIIAFDYDEKYRVVRHVPRPLAPCTHVILIVVQGDRLAPIYASFGAQCQMELLQPNGVYDRAYPDLKPLRQEVFGKLEAQPAFLQPLHPSMFRRVSGEVFRDVRYFENCISIDVSSEQIIKALAAIEVFRQHPPSYQLISKSGLNCSSFVARVIRQIDCNLPLLTPWPALHARAVDRFCSKGQLRRVGAALFQPRALTVEMQRTAMQVCGMPPCEMPDRSTSHPRVRLKQLRLTGRISKKSGKITSSHSPSV